MIQIRLAGKLLRLCKPVILEAVWLIALPLWMGLTKMMKDVNATKANCVSVIIPCYNQAHYLGEAIESILNQTYQHYEIIVVDDGSPDNTAEVAARYPGVRYVRQANQGLAGARNTGLRESKGEYVVFLDADDRLVPDAIKTNLNYMLTHSECALVTGQAQFISSDGLIIPMTHRPSVSEDHYPELLRYNYILVGTLLYRRDVLMSVNGFNASVPGCEDYELHLRLAREFPIFCHDEVIMEYRQHEASMSRDSSHFLKQMLRVYDAQRKHVSGNRKFEEARLAGRRMYQEFYGDRLAGEIRARVVSGEWQRATRSFMAFARYHPRGVLTHARRMLLTRWRRVTAR